MGNELDALSPRSWSSRSILHVRFASGLLVGSVATAIVAVALYFGVVRDSGQDESRQRAKVIVWAQSTADRLNDTVRRVRKVDDYLWQVEFGDGANVECVQVYADDTTRPVKDEDLSPCG